MFRNLSLALVMMATPPLAHAAPTKQHILFVAPHPDDEVLGTGAQIWKAQQRGDDYKVVIVTCGDAYDEALAAWKNSKAAKDRNGDGKIDYLDLGIARHDETLAALRCWVWLKIKSFSSAIPTAAFAKCTAPLPTRANSLA